MAIEFAKHNPKFLTEDGLVDGFVVRRGELNEILRVLRENTTDCNTHILITGARGSGKTTLALRVVAQVNRDASLSALWYPVVFGEESYNVMTPGEFWLRAILYITEQTQDENWHRIHADLAAEGDEVRLRERCLAHLVDFARAQGKRLLLVVENICMLLADQLSDDDAWVLRHTLQNESSIMLLGTATGLFDEVRDGSKAMFETFKTLPLQALTDAEATVLWGATTGADPGQGRIRPIQILTGGNPRLLSILARFTASMSFSQLMADLMELVDDHTDYFKSRLDTLPATERKVFVSLAELWDPATSRSVARAARLDVSKTSSLLNRLVSRSAVTVVETYKGTKWYQVAERMYNIYWLMRSRSATSARVRALVDFMVAYYEPQDLKRMAFGILDEADHLPPGLREGHQAAFATILSRLPHGEPIQALPVGGGSYPSTTKERLPAGVPAGTLTPIDERWEGRRSPAPDGNALDFAPGLTQAPKSPEPVRLHETLKRVDRLAETPEGVLHALEVLSEALAQEPESPVLQAALGQLLHERLERYDEAEAAYRKALETDPEYAWAWAKLGQLLHERLERYDEAEAAYRKALETDPEYAWAWAQLGQLLHERLERYDEAEAAYERALSCDLPAFRTAGELCALAHRRGRPAGQIAELADSLAARFPESAILLNSLAWNLAHFGDYDLATAAEHFSQQSVALRPHNPNYLHTLAFTLAIRAEIPRGIEALAHYTADTDFVVEHIADTVDLAVAFAAAGAAAETVRTISSSPSAKHLEPLIVALRMEAGEKVRVAAEVAQVAEDIVHRIRNAPPPLRPTPGSAN